MPNTTASPLSIRPFLASDYVAARRLWEKTEGMGLSASDEPDAVLAYLTRNPDLSLVAEDTNELVGTILVGHDGRRGYLNHLAVADAYRRSGLGRRLVDEGLAALKRAGISKCHLFAFETNRQGQAFWEAIGAQRRDDFAVFSFVL